MPIDEYEKLRRGMHVVSLDKGNALYYELNERFGKLTCNVPVYGITADSEKNLSRLMEKLMGEITQRGDCTFTVHLRADDESGIRLLSMLQFGIIAEKGVNASPIPMTPVQGITVRTLEKAEIEAYWPEIWKLTESIIQRLRCSPVFYPGTEFTETVYREFYLDEETHLHASFAGDGRIIGLIETNDSEDAPVLTGRDLANIGEIVVLPEYRRTGAAELLLSNAVEFERKRGHGRLWVEHGTANPNARYFWDLYFEPYEYEMVREVSVNRRESKTESGLYASHPVFPATDIRATAAFYAEKLGFRRVDYLDAKEPHVCLYRERVEIILTQSHGQKVIPNHVLYGYGGDAYIITRNQQELQDEFTEKGVKFVKRLEMTDYHNREFAIEDIDGRWLYFGIKE